jgi:predicted nuclease of restriction endonuclease-like (RecB) superfamily
MSELTKYHDAVVQLKKAILRSRYRAASVANAEQLTLYYNIGGYVSDNTRLGKWGTGAIEIISKQLQTELPGLRGYSPSNIKNMRVFFEEWALTFEPNRQLPTAENSEDSTLLEFRQLSTGELETDIIAAFSHVGFTHHTEILSKCKSLDERWYYICRCASEFWTVDALKSHLRARDYENYGALPNNFSSTLSDEKAAARAVRSFKDEYLLDFINISDSDDYDERDVEEAIVNDIKKFVMTFGNGFSFIGNQYRLTFNQKDYFVDLLFFNRQLKSLVAIDLKIGSFEPEYIGKMNFYLGLLDEQTRMPDENQSIGIILCADKDCVDVEIALRDVHKPIGVADYQLHFPTEDIKKMISREMAENWGKAGK